MPCPSGTGWRRGVTKDGQTIYVNDIEKITSWDPPAVVADLPYGEIRELEREKGIIWSTMGGSRGTMALSRALSFPLSGKALSIKGFVAVKGWCSVYQRMCGPFSSSFFFLSSLSPLFFRLFFFFLSFISFFFFFSLSSLRHARVVCVDYSMCLFAVELCVYAPGWRRDVTEKGQTIYVNDIDKTTSWDRPVLAAPIAPAPRHGSDGRLRKDGEEIFTREIKIFTREIKKKGREKKMRASLAPRK